MFSFTGIICNVRSDAVLYDFPPIKTGKRGRPAKHGKKLSIYEDFSLSANKIGEYFIGYREVLTNIMFTGNGVCYCSKQKRR
jgi:hypothetical protein